jgi:hypothetical protein
MPADGTTAARLSQAEISAYPALVSSQVDQPLFAVHMERLSRQKASSGG